VKKKLFFLTLGIISLQSSYAQNNVFKASLLSPIVSTYSFFYERALGSSGVTVNPGFFYTVLRSDGFQYNGFCITPSFRYYYPGFGRNEDGIGGIYADVFFRYQQIDATKLSSSSQAILYSTNAGILVGWHIIFAKHISLDFFLGPTLFISKYVKAKSGINTTSEFNYNLFTNYNYRGGITLGFAF